MSKPKVIVTRRWPQAVEARLSELFDTTLNDSDTPMDAAALKQAMASCDALCPTVSDKITADVIGANGATAKVIGNYGEILIEI